MENAYNDVKRVFKEKTGIEITLQHIGGDVDDCPAGMEDYYWVALNAFTMNPDYVKLSNEYQFDRWSNFSAGS